MKLSFHLGVLIATLLSSTLTTTTQATEVNQPAQTFFVPLPEEDLFQQTFKQINKYKARQPVNTLISVVVSTDDTRVYYDEWEDGYDHAPTNPERETTKIWGDGNAENGCAQTARLKGKTCTDADDVLLAGDSFVLESTIPALESRPKTTPSGTLEPLYDGKDRITATKPVTVVRASYPEEPGSLMAGAVEVLDTDSWGTSFVCPVGPNDDTSTDAFEYTYLYVMASEDGTTIKKNGGNDKVLAKGESYQYSASQGDLLTSNKPVQVDLLTGDKGSNYELRWFSLLPDDEWSNEYFSPVGDSRGKTKVYLYNAGSKTVTVQYDYLASGTKKTGTVTLNSKRGGLTGVIPSGSGAHFKCNDKFIALSLTDFVQGGGWHGQMFDWGFPVMPVSHLSEQVVIGLGFGCTKNRCHDDGNTNERSAVFVGCIEDCYVHIDFDNDGQDDKVVFQKALESTINLDTKHNDKDMSGSLIYATQGESKESTAVPIAAAWGQNPAFSGSGDSSAMDLGTVVLPFSSLRAKKFMSLYKDVDKNLGFSSGDTIEFVIEVTNVGQVDVEANTVTVVDNTVVNWKYKPGTFVYEVEDGSTISVADATGGSSPFPLGGKGLKNQAKILKRGGTHKLRFLAKIPYTLDGEIVRNAGYLKQPLRPNQPFAVEEPIAPPLIWPRTSGGSCMYDNWKDHGKKSKLTCTAKHVYIEEAVSDEPKSCEVGKPIKLTLKAKVHFNGDTYDPGWFIATDGGNAMEGNCALAVLEETNKKSMRLVKSATSNILAGESEVKWAGDAGNDECGDVLKVPSDGGAVLDYVIAVDTELLCADTDGDNRMDFNICFSWRKPEDDHYCGIQQQLSEGNAPDLYPGDKNSCFCASVKVPNVIALDPGDKTFPC